MYRDVIDAHPGLFYERKREVTTLLRIIFMGTPQFAVPVLTAVLQGSTPGVVLSDGYEVVTVITRPDKPVGRGRRVVYSPVKQAALERGLPVWQPGSLKRRENSEALAGYGADLYIVAAFGQILPQVVLDQPRYGTLNIHASLLPKYRGVSPISEAILQGDAESGVSIMLLDAGIDTGPVLALRSVTIAPDETTGSLTVKLADVGARILLDTLPLWIAGQIVPEAQDAQQASYTALLRKEDGKIDWGQAAVVLARRLRAYAPWPGAYTFWRGKLLKILSAHALPLEPAAPLPAGTVTTRAEAGHETLAIVTGSGFLVIERLQLEGKKAMGAEEFLRGYRHMTGDILL